jgi:hypothetical protein
LLQLSGYIFQIWGKLINIVRSKGMERVYKVLKKGGARSIVTGILLIVAGIVFGVLNIVTGASLLRNRRNILF